MTAPQGFHIRHAQRDDLPQLAQLHVKVFHETHGRGREGPSYELRLTQWRAYLDAPGEAFCLLVTRESELVGFAKGMPRQEAELPEFTGELNKIYLLRRVQGIGLGKALFCAAARGFLARAIRSMVLFGDARSPSNGFYEKMGGERLLSPEGEFHGGYGWRDLSSVLEHCGKTG